MFFINTYSFFVDYVFFNNFVYKIIDTILPVFFIENFFIQFFILYILFLISINSNLYYCLLYVFAEFIFFGLFIGMYQMELFTGFLWVVEFTVVFISVVLLFYLNVDGLYFKYNNNSNIIFYIPFFFFLFSFLILIIYQI